MTEQPLNQARRLGRLEGIAEQLDCRLAAIERTLVAFRSEVTRRMDSQFRWIVGLLFGVVGLQLTVLLKVLN